MMEQPKIVGAPLPAHVLARIAHEVEAYWTRQLDEACMGENRRVTLSEAEYRTIFSQDPDYIHQLCRDGRLAVKKDIAMDDYRDEHAPDIALLLVVARVVKDIIGGARPADTKAIDDALKPFERYPDPTEYRDD